MTLRLVSKTTKQWADQPKYLQRFQIRVDSQEKQKELIESNVPWNNFTIKFFTEGPELLSKFCDTFGPVIKHVNLIQEYGYKMYDDGILKGLSSTNLESLTIDKVRFLPNTTYKIKVNTFQNLKSLQIEGLVYYRGHIQENTKYWFDFILQSCSNLNYLKLPALYLSGERLDDELGDTIFLQPLLNYLKRFEVTSRRIVLEIDLENLSLSQTTWPLTPEGFYGLAQICGRIGARLSNVPIFVLPTTLEKKNKEMINKTTVNIKCINVNMDLRNIYIPSSVKVYVEIGGFGQPNFDSLELPSRIQTLYFEGSQYVPSNRRLSAHLRRALFEIRRPDVVNLICHVNRDYQVAQVSDGRSMSFNFSNLKKLTLRCPRFCANDFNDLLSGLLFLESLSLIDCLNLTDAGILGHDLNNPIILKLKHLVHLKIESHFNEDTTKISDLSFMHAFRFMRLKSFVYIYPSGRVTDIQTPFTFTSGVSKLASIRDGFANSIEFFEMTKPSDCSEDAMAYFIKSRFTKLNSSIKGSLTTISPPNKVNPCSIC